MGIYHEKSVQQILGQGVRVRAGHDLGVLQGRQDGQDVAGDVLQGRGAHRPARRHGRRGHRLHQEEVRVARQAGQRGRVPVPGAQRGRDAPVGEHAEERVRTGRGRHAVPVPDAARGWRQTRRAQAPQLLHVEEGVKWTVVETAIAPPSPSPKSKIGVVCAIVFFFYFTTRTRIHFKHTHTHLHTRCLRRLSRRIILFNK